MPLSQHTKVTTTIGGVVIVAMAVGAGLWKTATAWAGVETAIEQNAKTDAAIADLLEELNEREKASTRSLQIQVDEQEEELDRIQLLIERLIIIEELERQR